jgi:hypothetical protein
MGALAANIATAFQEYFVVTSPNGSAVIGDGSLDVTTWALFLGLVPDTLRDVVTRSIEAAIKRNGTHMFTGNFATSFLFRRGSSWGLSDVIYGSLAQV